MSCNFDISFWVRSGIYLVLTIYAPALLVPAVIVGFTVSMILSTCRDRKAKRDHAAAVARWEQRERQRR